MSMIDIYVRDKNSGKIHRVGDDLNILEHEIDK